MTVAAWASCHPCEGALDKSRNTEYVCMSALLWGPENEVLVEIVRTTEAGHIVSLYSRGVPESRPYPLPASSLSPPSTSPPPPSPSAHFSPSCSFTSSESFPPPQVAPSEGPRGYAQPLLDLHLLSCPSAPPLARPLLCTSSTLQCDVFTHVASSTRVASPALLA
eukprot:8283584-Pyramimonas_sp.AAC.1